MAIIPGHDSHPELIRGLAEADFEILGLMPGSSNYTFLGRLAGDEGALVVYKPRKGETPLWDFPSGTLCQREVAAYLVCEAAGWDFIPPTVLREGPAGPGMMQQFIDHDPAHNAFNLAEDHPDELRRIALFDLVVNNADRKAGHVLRDRAGRLWCIDHGLCFHEENKLRTVLWDFIGEPVPDEGIAALERLLEALRGGLIRDIADLLLPEEINRMFERVQKLRDSGLFPAPGPGRPYPWPPI